MRQLKKQISTVSPLSISVVALFAFVMSYIIFQAFAAIGPATLYTSPGGSQSVTKGNTFDVNVQISTASNVPVTGASVYLTYPTDKLSVQGISYNNSPYNTQLYQNDSSGVLRMDRLANPMIPGGDNLFAKVTFKANNVGAADINFASNSIVTSGEDDSNILSVRNGVTYNIDAPPPPPPPTDPSPPSSPAPSGGGSASTPSGSSQSSGQGSAVQSNTGSGSGTSTANPLGAAPSADEQSGAAASESPSTATSAAVARLIDNKRGFNPWLVAIPALVFGGLALGFLFSRFFLPRLREMYLLKRPNPPLNGLPTNPLTPQVHDLPNYANTPKPGETFQPSTFQPSTTQPVVNANTAVSKTIIKGH